MMIIASEEHSENINDLLIENGYPATEIGRNGDFLQYGDTVLILGVESGQSDNVIRLLKEKGGIHPGKDLPYNEEVRIFMMQSDKLVKVNA